MKNINLSKLIYYLAASILLIIFLAFILEKSQVINLYSKPVKIIPATTRPVNDIDYSPAAPTDNDVIEAQKKSGTLGSNEQSEPKPGEAISVVLTAATQDTKGGPVVVRVLLPDVKQGSCIITMVKESIVKSYTKQVVNAGNNYICEPIDIPIADLSEGAWTIKVDVTDADRAGSVTQEIEVNS